MEEHIEEVESMRGQQDKPCGMGHIEGVPSCMEGNLEPARTGSLEGKQAVGAATYFRGQELLLEYQFGCLVYARPNFNHRLLALGQERLVAMACSKDSFPRTLAVAWASCRTMASKSVVDPSEA